jgi:hypothetical protein
MKVIKTLQICNWIAILYCSSSEDKENIDDTKGFPNIIYLLEISKIKSGIKPCHHPDLSENICVLLTYLFCE